MFRYITSGESHGKGLMAIVDGVPAGLFLDEGLINSDLVRRMKGYGRGGRMQIEEDKVQIMSGCRAGVTIGSPVGMIILNKDYKIDELPDVHCPRPGHADLAGIQKYGFKDARSVLERASARETAARVAVGSVAKMILGCFGIKVMSHVTMLGGIEAVTAGLTYEEIFSLAEKSDLRCADAEAASRMREEIDKAKEAGDTLGGAFEVAALGVPPGLGSYTQWDRKLDGALARAVMSIPAVKACSIGEGIEFAAKKGSETHDSITQNSKTGKFSRLSNNAGGTEGGVTNGEAVIVKGFMKPIATLASPLDSVDIRTGKKSSAATERSDVTAVPACGVVAESAVATEIAAAFLDKFGGDSMKEIKRNYDGYMASI